MPSAMPATPCCRSVPPARWPTWRPTITGMATANRPCRRSWGSTTDRRTRPRRIVAKVEINRSRTNRRFVVNNLPWPAQGVHHGSYAQRGNVPERPLRELKHGLDMVRLSCHGFRTNAVRLLEHVLAYAIGVLYREATAAAVPEMATAEVSTWRTRLWKVGAVVRTSTRRIVFHLSAT